MAGPQTRLHPVSTDRVEVRYGADVVFSEVSLQIPHGVTALLGHNGAGKSSLLRVLVGAQTPSSGKVLRNGGGILASAKARAAHRAATGWLPQRPGLPGSVTVTSFLDYVAWHIDLPKNSRAAEVQRVLESTDCASVARLRIRTLSGGQRQRVALAAALLGNPDLLLLDEPTAGLDPSQRELFYRTANTVSSEASVILSTHLIEDVLAVADQVFVVAGHALHGPHDVASAVALNEPGQAMSTIRALMDEPR